MRRAAILLLLFTACPMPGEAWGRCDADLSCEGDFVCHAQYAGEPDNVVTMCIAENPTFDPADCPDAFIVDRTLDSHGVSTCRIPCDTDADCYPEVGVVCGVTGSCGWTQ